MIEREDSSQFLVTNTLLEPILPSVLPDSGAIIGITDTMSDVEMGRRKGQALLWVSRFAAAISTGLMGSEDLKPLALPMLVVAAATTVAAFSYFNDNQRRIEAVMDQVAGGLQSREDLSANPEISSGLDTLIRAIPDLAYAERAVGSSKRELNANLLLQSGVLFSVAPEIWPSIITASILGLGQINLFHKIFANQEKLYQDIRTRVRDLSFFGRSDPTLNNEMKDQRKRVLQATNLVIGISRLTTNLPLFQALFQSVVRGNSTALLPALVDPLMAALSSRESIGQLMDGVVGMNWLRMKGQLAREYFTQLVQNIPNPLTFLSSESDWNVFRERNDEILAEIPAWGKYKRFLVLENFNPARLDNNKMLFFRRCSLRLNLEDGIAFIRSPSGAGKSTLMKALIGRLRYLGEIGLYPHSSEKVRSIKNYSKVERDMRLMGIECDEVLPSEGKMPAIDLFLTGENGFQIQLNLLNDDYNLDRQHKLEKAAINSGVSTEKLEQFLRLNAAEKEKSSRNSKELQNIWNKIRSGLTHQLEADFGKKRADGISGSNRYFNNTIFSTEYGKEVLLKSCSFFRKDEKISEILNRGLETCSSGQLARLKLALAYMSKTDLMVIDEPLRALQYSEVETSDYQHMVRILRMMAKRTGMIIIIHDDPETILHQFKSSAGSFLELNDQGLTITAEKISLHEARDLTKKVKTIIENSQNSERLLETVTELRQVMGKTLNRMGILGEVSEFKWRTGDHREWIRNDDIRDILDPIISAIRDRFNEVIEKGNIGSVDKVVQLNLLSNFARDLQKWGVARVGSREMIDILKREVALIDRLSMKYGDRLDDFINFLREIGLGGGLGDDLGTVVNVH